MLVSTRCDYSSFNTSILSKISSSTPFVYPLFFWYSQSHLWFRIFEGWSCSLMTLVCLAVLFCDTSRLFVFDGVIEFYVTVFDCLLSLQLERADTNQSCGALSTFGLTVHSCVLLTKAFFWPCNLALSCFLIALFWPRFSVWRSYWAQVFPESPSVGFCFKWLASILQSEVRRKILVCCLKVLKHLITQTLYMLARKWVVTRWPSTPWNIRGKVSHQPNWHTLHRAFQLCYANYDTLFRE